MSSFDERFEALRARFVRRCARDLPVLEAGLEDRADPDALRSTVHRLSGAAGTFGYAELSRLAGAVDDRLVVGEIVPRADLVQLVEAVRVLTRG